MIVADRGDGDLTLTEGADGVYLIDLREGHVIEDLSFFQTFRGLHWSTSDRPPASIDGGSMNLRLERSKRHHPLIIRSGADSGIRFILGPVGPDNQIVPIAPAVSAPEG